ncbi:hypothetical protein GDO78_004579 [Eleutherodactylus coqui]|uniref:Uncharacterized protein n=1 Tax=Eleutherodactylus coqui TaxID=57060 RepID=A0A8J6ESK6_ELECQ|nr:hypothetical protein GDO78_004579 [Eleutherodactylus coqui]
MLRWKGRRRSDSPMPSTFPAFRYNRDLKKCTDIMIYGLRRIDFHQGRLWAGITWQNTIYKASGGARNQETGGRARTPLTSESPRLGSVDSEQKSHSPTLHSSSQVLLQRSANAPTNTLSA